MILRFLLKLDCCIMCLHCQGTSQEVEVLELLAERHLNSHQGVKGETDHGDSNFASMPYCKTHSKKRAVLGPWRP